MSKSPKVKSIKSVMIVKSNNTINGSVSYGRKKNDLKKLHPTDFKGNLKKFHTGYSKVRRTTHQVQANTKFTLGIIGTIFLIIGILAVAVLFRNNPENIQNYEFSSRNFLTTLSNIQWPELSLELIQSDSWFANFVNSVTGLVSLPFRVAGFIISTFFQVITMDLFVPV